ncbi:MAG: nucleotidyltransferase family protein [Brevundimonas sp.]|uniref:nucleotidyltransferase family protein n=1 Tax=Brevundimonas sp. TaxID=1871086 RepID=UPI0039193126
MSPRELAPYLLSDQATLREAIERLDAIRGQLVVIVDEAGRLRGSLTDGDVRRALLRMTPMEACVDKAMNPDPVAVRPGHNPAEIQAELNALGASQAPVVDREGQVVGLYPEHYGETGPRDNLVVIMAGGRGARLAPLTRHTPKPMLTISGRPLLETIIQRLRDQGFGRFRLAVNYLAEVIEGHFGDGSAFDVEISYLRESEPRGTAGALALLEEPIDGPFLVMNGDVLTRLDFGQLLAFHGDHDAAATVCVREHRFETPYGVVETEGHRLVSIREKPTFRWFANAGIYVLGPEALKQVPTSGHYDMPTLLAALTERGDTVGAFPIHEYWIDIGRPPDFDLARSDYEAVFAAPGQ